MTVKYTFTEEHFNRFKGNVEYGIMSEFFAVDLVYDFISKDLESTSEQVAELKFQFLQALAQRENKPFEEVVSYYEKINHENDLRIAKEMEPELDCWIEIIELDKEIEELETMIARLNAIVPLKKIEREMKEAEWKAFRAERYFIKDS